ncbi:hypothetical protein DYB26_010392 [Aphanomyces astaci]|uniref:DDE-1 domain-containing protein n=1 Tax=Aphanomyces astaci TaxID=112090 RepID=A0A418EX49_APHAT|nr:hypothetical protein DYB26_010392 [Aphanomyces astaci]
MITWIKTYQLHWIEEYRSNKVSNIRAYQALMLLCQRFAHRNGFSQRIPCYSKLKMHELQEVQRTYAASLWTQRHDQPLRGIVNVDETAVYYDMPPRTKWCLVGEDSKVDSFGMNSDRLTAVIFLIPQLQFLRFQTGARFFYLAQHLFVGVPLPFQLIPIPCPGRGIFSGLSAFLGKCHELLLDQLFKILAASLFRKQGLFVPIVLGQDRLLEFPDRLFALPETPMLFFPDSFHPLASLYFLFQTPFPFPEGFAEVLFFPFQDRAISTGDVRRVLDSEVPEGLLYRLEFRSLRLDLVPGRSQVPVILGLK